MDELTIWIFRVNKNFIQEGAVFSLPERYIALISEYQTTPQRWYSSDTLSGLAALMSSMTLLKWTEIEKELQGKNVYQKVLIPQ